MDGEINKIVCKRRSDSLSYDCHSASEKSKKGKAKTKYKIKSLAYRFARAVDSVISPQNQQKAVHYSQYGLLLNPVTALAGCDSFGAGILHGDGGKDAIRRDVLRDLKPKLDTRIPDRLIVSDTIKIDAAKPDTLKPDTKPPCPKIEWTVVDPKTGPGESLATDSSGNIYVGVVINSKAHVNKYDSSGKQIWSKPTGTNGIAGLSVDASQNIYLTTSEVYVSGFSDYNIFVRKFDPSMNLLWTNTFDGKQGKSEDFGVSSVVDSSGNVYATGGTEGISGFFDLWARKIDPNNKVMWTTIENLSQNGHDYGVGINLDSLGNPYITGGVYETGQGNNIFLVKLNGITGKSIWAKPATYNGSGSGDDVGNAVAVDSLGNVYVVGSEMASGGKASWFGRFNTKGKLISQWGSYINALTDVAVDASGNVYTAGYETGSGLGKKYSFVVSFSPYSPYMLKNRWTDLFKGEGENNWVNSLKVDSKGNVYVTGDTQDKNKKDQFFLRQYSQKNCP